MKAYKTEIKLNKEQERLYKLNVSACRVVHNLFISVNKERFKNKESYLNNYAFSKWFNNEYIPNNLDKQWLKLASSKAIRKTIDNCNTTYLKFFKSKKGFPKFKKASTDKTGYYFVRANNRQPIKCFRHKINIPCFGQVHLKEKGYLPQSNIISGSITKRAGRYFISVIIDENSNTINNNFNEGIGIDLGITTFMTCSNNLTFSNINKTKQIKKLEKKLKREQRSFNRKLEANKTREVKTYSNIDKNKLRVERVYFKLECIRNAYINKCIDKIIQSKPKYITLENLNISGMLKNRHLSKAIKDCKFYYTKQVIIQKATKNNIEVREVDRFYPSSKTCSSCGNIKEELKLKDKIYKCSECNLIIDRDLNASINLRECKEYKLLNNIENINKNTNLIKNTSSANAEYTDGLSGINACGVLYQTKVSGTSATKIGYDETRKSILRTKDRYRPNIGVDNKEQDEE